MWTAEESNKLSVLGYLGVNLSKSGRSEDAVRARVKVARNEWREASGVIKDKRVPRKLMDERNAIVEMLNNNSEKPNPRGRPCTRGRDNSKNDMR